MDERSCEVGRGVTLCYETFGDPADPAALLIMGLATQMVAWHEQFCRELASRGLHVVRFDNRDIGRSTHMQGRPPTIPQLLRRSRRAASYTLADMAQDAARLLQELGLAPAHVIGILRFQGHNITPATVVLIALLLISGSQFTLFAMWFDMESNKDLR